MTYSQTPQPNFNYYQPAYPAPQDPLAPARRASILMYILGGLVLLGGGCCIGVGILLPSLIEQQPELGAAISNVPGATEQLVQVAFVVFGILTLFLGVAQIILARFVSRGGKGAVITSIIVSILMGLFLLFGVVQNAFNSAQKPAERGMGVCMMCVPLAMLALLIVWLFQAFAAAGRVANIQQQYAQQYWQYYQRQQQYGGGPYQPPGQFPPQMQSPPPPPPTPPQ